MFPGYKQGYKAIVVFEVGDLKIGEITFLEKNGYVTTAAFVSELLPLILLFFLLNQFFR